MPARETPMPDLVIHAERCVHPRVRGAACTGCVDACPTQAWRADADGLDFDPDACDACGLCVAACPTEALELPPPQPAFRTDSHGQTSAWWGCERAGIAGQAANVPCVLALAPTWLHQISRLHGVREHVLVPGACGDCARGASRSEWQRQWQALAARGSPDAPAPRLRVAPPDAWPVAPAAPSVDARRRGFLRGKPASTPVTAMPALTSAREAVLGGPPPAPDAPPAPVGPLWSVALTPARCTLCLSCVRICPINAITLEAQSQDMAPTCFVLDGQRCTGCGLCTAVCDTQALSAPQATDPSTRVPAAGPARWPITQRTCSRCKIDFRQFTGDDAPAHSPSHLCPACEQGRPVRPNRLVQSESTP